MLDRVDADIKQALLDGDKPQAEALKMLKSAVLLAEKEAGSLDEAGFYEVVRKQIKMRKDAIAMYEQSGSVELAAKEKSEIELLEVYLPEQMNQQELTALVEEVANTNSISFEKQNMGKLIGMVAAKAGEHASKADIAKVINSKIS